MTGDDVSTVTKGIANATVISKATMIPRSLLQQYDPRSVVTMSF
jgi:hypothetical protein